MPGSPRPGSRGAPTQGWERPLLRSRRSWVWNQFFVIEEYAGPEPVLIGRLHSDVDRGEGQIKYVLTGEGAGTVFVIDERTGNVLVTKTLDREEKAQYTLLAQAVDQASNRPLEPPSEFIIKVQDVNDHPPVCLRGPYHATAPEMSSVGVVCTAIPNMDREAQAELLVVIQAKDMGGQAGGLLGSVTVTLSDVNDNPPKFPQSERPSAPPGSSAAPAPPPHPLTPSPALLMYSAPWLGGDWPLDFEQRPAYTLRVEAANTQVDPLYIRQGPFKDVAAVEDAAEPPSLRPAQLPAGCARGQPPGTVVGKITASNLDMPSSAIRYSILPHSDPGRYFSISPQDGTLRTALPLDRETLAWHNITVVATELDSPARAAPVPLAVHALDVNDNVPQLAPGTEPFICHGTAPGQLIQTIWARDRDDGGAGSRMVQPLSCSRPCGCPPPGGPPLLVPLELVDGGRPALTGTPTLTLSICQCRPDGSLRSCQPPPRCPCPPGLSTAALLAILGCGTSLLVPARAACAQGPLLGRSQGVRQGGLVAPGACCFAGGQAGLRRSGAGLLERGGSKPGVDTVPGCFALL
ncbi:unnamed protein product [Caretta caretta]